MKTGEIVERTERFVRTELQNDSSGHDWWHVYRVRAMAVDLAHREGGDVYIVELASLLHDVSDYKLNGGDLERGPQIARDWLTSIGESDGCAAMVADIIATLSFKGAGASSEMATIEGKVVQDADRLDALGAIGVARAFAFGGHAGQALHDPDLPPRLHATPEEYLSRNGTTINHFYEKLLLLKDRMQTQSARIIAERRHQVLEAFLGEFLLEWDAGDMAPKLASLAMNSVVPCRGAVR